MRNFWILLIGFVSASGYFLLNCQCIENTAVTEIYHFDDDSIESSFCEFCDYYYGDYTTSDNIIEASLATTESFVSNSPPDRTSPHIKPVPRKEDTTLTPICLKENQTSIDEQIIVWPETMQGNRAVSDPICLDKSLKIVSRQCNDVWDIAPICASIQQPIDPCPPDLKSIDGRYCYTVVSNSTYPPDCPYPGPLGWNKYINAKINFETPVWMPLTRYDTVLHGIDILRYTELTNLYSVPFQICTQSCLTFFYEDSFMDKTCQVFHNDTHVEGVSCDSEYSAICVYDAMPHQQSSLCEQTNPFCKQGGYEADSKCFCVTTQPNTSIVLAEFLWPYQNLLFKNNSCKIGLQNNISNDAVVPFIWTPSNTRLNYTYWSPDVNFDNTHGVMTNTGWTLDDGDTKCSIYELSAPAIEPGQLILNNEDMIYILNITNYKSFLSKNNSNPVVHCFTDADAKSIIYSVTNFTEASPSTTNEQNFIIRFPPINLDQSGPGNYWCQAFLYPNLTVVTSNMKRIMFFKAEYVVIFRMNNYEDKLSTYPLIPENLETLQNLFRNEIPNNCSFFPRILKINGIDETKKEINITFHLTSAEGVNDESEYNTLRNICKGQSLFEFLEFRNVHYCSSTTTPGAEVTWPTTVWKQTTYPVNGHCVTADGSLVQRTCIGNFVDGVYWSRIEDFCHFYPESILTDQLLNISSQTESDQINIALNELSKISKTYDSFNTLDLLLASKFIRDIALKKPDLDVLAEIVSNLMKIQRPVLLSAQLNFRATDMLLESVDLALENGDYGEWKKPNFAIKSINIKNENTLGLLLQNCTNHANCDLVPITNISLLQDQQFILNQTVEAAVSLSTDLYDQLIDCSKTNDSFYPKLIVSIYYGSQLFVELENSRSSNMVFGVLLPQFTEAFKGPVTLYYFTDVKRNLLKHNCSYWQFSERASGSWTIEDIEELNGAVVCQFYHITNFGFPITFPSEEDDVGEEEITEDHSSTCIPDDEVSKTCSTTNQYGGYELCTELNLGTTIRELCLTENLTVIPTICFKNFTGVALISDMSDNCTMHQLSSTFKDIMGDIHTTDMHDSILDLLLVITSNYKSISEIEIFFVVSFMKTMSKQPIDLSKLAGIVNNLMSVPLTNLATAQAKFGVVDTILSTTEDFLIQGTCGHWKTSKFLINCLEIDEEHVGVVMKNCSEDLSYCDVKTINSSFLTSNDPVKSENSIDAVIVLSNKLYNQIIDYHNTINSSYYPKLIITMYKGSEFFVDMSATFSVSNLVFGVLLPNFNEQFLGPLLIIRLFEPTKLIQYNCSYWKFDNNNYGTWVMESNKWSNNAIICPFYHLTNFVIPFKIIQQVEHNLANFIKFDERDLFDNQSSVSFLKNNIVSNHFQISLSKQTNVIYDLCNIDDYMKNILIQMYACEKKCVCCPSTSSFLDDLDINLLNNFYDIKTSIDLVTNTQDLVNLRYLTETFEKSKARTANFKVQNIGFGNLNVILKILEITNPTLTTLELLADVVNLYVSDAKMFNFQTRMPLTDIVLYNLDRVLIKFKETMEVKREHVIFITISKEDVEHFQGFFITTEKEVVCLFNYVETTDDNTVAVVILNPEVRQQIKDAESSIIFTVFYNEMLFPVTDKTKIVLPIIEVLIPGLNEELKSIIVIKYKSTFKGKCSYWDHEINEIGISKAGSWKTEFDAEFDGNISTCNFQHVTHFALVYDSQNITTDLEEILASNLTALEKLKQVESITTSNPNNLVPIDIYLISQIITNSLSEGPNPMVVTRIISNLFMVPRKVLRESQTNHSATDIILYAVDEMARMLNNLDFHHQNFSLIVKNLDSVNFTGVVLHDCKAYQCRVDELDQVINISAYSGNQSISAMVTFSEELVNQIRNCTDNPKVAISVFYSNVLFNEVRNERNTTKIFGVIFPGLQEALNGTVSATFNIGSESSSETSNQCAYWQYKADPIGNNATLGEWMNDTNELRKNKMAICSYSHVTHFGMLLGNGEEYDDDPILDAITDIGCILSLFGILMIFLTAMLFKKWRQNTGNKILINFSAAISVKIITLYVSVYVKTTSSGIACTITGIILHYAILSECAWMLTVAILQFKRFVEVLGGPPKYVLVKAIICGWVFPVIPVSCVLSIDPENYEKGVANLCYPSNLGLYLGVWLPVLLVLAINCVIFTFIIYNVFHKKTENIDNSNQDILFQWRLALLLFFMLGLNWIFGFFGQIKGTPIFTYLYSITASLQGFILFLFFIVFNKSTRFLYSQTIKQWFYARGMFKVWKPKNSKY